MNKKISAIIETDRLLLRTATHQDTQSIYQLYSLPESSHYEYWEPIDLAKANRLVRRWVRNQQKHPCSA